MKELLLLCVMAGTMFIYQPKESSLKIHKKHSITVVQKTHEKNIKKIVKEVRK